MIHKERQTTQKMVVKAEALIFGSMYDPKDMNQPTTASEDTFI